MTSSASFNPDVQGVSYVSRKISAGMETISCIEHKNEKSEASYCQEPKTIKAMDKAAKTDKESS